MSDHRRIVPSDTPRARAAWEVESPRGLMFGLSMGPFLTDLESLVEASPAIAQDLGPKMTLAVTDATIRRCACASITIMMGRGLPIARQALDRQLRCSTRSASRIGNGNRSSRRSRHASA